MKIYKNRFICLLMSFALIFSVFSGFLSTEASETFFSITENFEKPESVATSITSGYNGWKITTSSKPWADKDIVFYQETDNNISAKFTAAVADSVDSTQIDSNRKLRYFDYDLSSVTNSDYFQLEYSLKSTGVANVFRVYIDNVELGVNFTDMSIGGKVYGGSADSNGWYNIKIISSTKSGRTYIFVNGNIHQETNIEWAARAGFLRFGLERTACSGADIQLDNIAFSFLSEDGFYEAAGITTGGTPMVFVLGDSTAADYGKVTEFDMTGWGQVLYNFMTNPYMIKDCAVPGTSSKSFYNLYWSGIKEKVQEGDYVLIQFGHNDSKKSTSTSEDLVPVGADRYTSPTDSASTEGSFKWYLSKYVTEIKEKGAYPVFVTSIERRNHAITKLNDSSYVSTLESYVKAMSDLGKDLNVPVLDLHAESIDLISDYEANGADYSKYLYYVSLDENSNDNTHLSREGAMEISKRFAKLLAATTDETLVALRANVVDNPDDVYFEKLLYKLEEDFESDGLKGTSIASGYNGWEINTSSKPWADKDIVFKEDGSDNIVANFTSEETSDTYANTDRKMHYFKYTLSDVTDSDYFALKYSLKPNGTKNKQFSVLASGVYIGTVDFSTMKIGGVKYGDGTYISDWYNIELYGNLKSGDVYIYVNDTYHTKNTLVGLNSISDIRFGLERANCGGSDIDLDNVVFEFVSEDKYCSVTGEERTEEAQFVRLVTKGTNLLGIRFSVNVLPAENQKFITAVYDGDLLKGAAITTLTKVGEYDVIFDTPLTVASDNIVRIYFWDMESLKPLAEAIDPLS